MKIDKITLKNLVGAIPVNGDNLVIALIKYFEDQPARPDQGINEHGWVIWSVKQAEAVLDKIVETILKEVKTK
jgi:hypothetical protein